MKRRRWFDDDIEIRRRHADRMMYRPVNREPFPRPEPTSFTLPNGIVISNGPSMLPDLQVARAGGMPPTPEVDRSVHMRPAETRHPPAEARRRDRAREWAGEVGAVAGELVGELVGWLLRRLL